MKQTRKETRLKFYKTMAVPVLLYGCETWVPIKKIKIQIQTSEIMFSEKNKGLHETGRNEDIREELQIFSINDKIQTYRREWLPVSYTHLTLLKQIMALCHALGDLGSSF